MTDGDAADWRGLNRANWDDRVPVHLASEFYDLDGFRTGASSLRPFEVAEAGDVTSKRLVHLRCHVGEFLCERDFDFFQRFESLERHDGEYRFPAGRPSVPMTYSLRAILPA